MKLRELIYAGRDRLDRADIQCADKLRHMKQIAEHCLKMDTAQLVRRWEEEVPPEAEAALWAFVERREKGEPFQYIAGHEWFWDAPLSVGPGVLIPRRETEILVEAILGSESRERVRVAELGAGSGNIGIACLRERPGWTWVGFERNEASLPYLEANVRQLVPSDARYRVERGDYFEGAGALAPFDWVVSNAPYVRTDDFPSLAKEIHHEPRAALDGGADGLQVIRRFISQARQWLTVEGGIAGEMAAEQGKEVLQCLQDSGFLQTRVIQDYSGLDRIFLGRRGD